MGANEKSNSDLVKVYKYAWDKYTDEELGRVFSFAEGYKAFMSKCKTERECVKEFIALAESHGYRNLEEVMARGERLKPGDKLYANNMGKTLVLVVIGQQPLEKGMRILGAHIDSPRLDLKQNPLYEDSGLAMLETHYYGGIKKYQWVAIPLAIHGVVVKKDGTVIDVVIGEKDDDFH
jgi:aspartyl aminopeptidase